jgi:putative PEP-CTERM system TPR-repeat lipoprotein
MKKKYLLVILAILVLGAAAAGGAWYWHRSNDQLGQARAALARGDLRTAQLELRTAVRNDPKNAEAHFRLGSVQLTLGDAVAAEKELKLAQAGGWSAKQILPLLARAELAQGRFKDVLKDFPVEGLPPDQAGPLLVSQALAQLALKDLDAALAAITEAEKLTPQSVEAALAAARVALARSDQAAAEAKVDRALEINPRSVEALTVKGELLQAKGQREAALIAFDKAIEIVPDALSLRLERANTLLVLGQDQKAREDVDAVLKADARNPLGNYFLGVLLVRAGDWTGADAALQRISPLLSRFPRGEYFLALVKANLNQTEQAADAADRYVVRVPGDIAGYKLLARIEGRARQPQKVIDALNRAVNAGIADVEILELLGGAYTQAGQTAQANAALDKAESLAGNNAEQLARIAALRLGSGDPGGAERDLSRSLEITPEQANTGERLVVAALAAGDVNQAAAELEKLRRQPKPDPEKVGILTGLVRLGQLDLEGARVAFEDVLKADPKSVAAQLNLARVLTTQGKNADAEKLLTGILATDPANASALSAISGILLAQNRADQLIELLETARKAVPGNAGLPIAEASVMAAIGDPRRGYAVIEQLPKEQATLPGVLAARVRLQLALGMEKEAQETCRQILAASPANLEVRRRLVELLMKSKDFDEARTVAGKGLETQPGNRSLLQMLVAIDYRASGLDAALRTITVLARNPENQPVASVLKGGLYMSLRRYADAAAAYKAELDAKPSPILVTDTAIALNAAGRHDDANRTLTDWLAHQPDDLQVRQMLASLQIQNHNLDDAAKNLKTILAKQPDDAVALNNLAWIYQQKNDPQARAVAQKAYLISPTAQAADTLGWILTTQGEPATGLVLLRQAAGQVRNDPAMAYHLAVALNATGNRDEAVSLLTQLANAKGEFEDKPAVRKLLDQLGGPKPPAAEASGPKK